MGEMFTVVNLETHLTVSHTSSVFLGACFHEGEDSLRAQQHRECVKVVCGCVGAGSELRLPAPPPRLFHNPSRFHFGVWGPWGFRREGSQALFPLYIYPKLFFYLVNQSTNQE